MKFTPQRKLFFALSLCYLVFTFTSLSFAQDKDWQPITPAEMAAKTSIVEPNADAEALFWEVRVDDSSQSELALRHYVRIKIFTEKGKDDFSKRDIVFLKGTKVKDVEAKVTKPDGSVSYLAKADVLEREIVKANGFKVRAKSFALPGLEPGSILEYKYREVIDYAAANNMRLIFQRDIPIRTISYYIRPHNGSGSMFYTSFNMKDVKFEKDKKDFYRATMNNVPAFHEEPYMLPEDEVKAWVYIYYAGFQTSDPAKYWLDWSQTFYEASKKLYKANKEVEATAQRVIASAKTDNEKLDKIYNFVKTEIKNLSYSEKEVSDDVWKKVLKNESAADTLKLKMGSPSDVDQLFGAMAQSVGFEVRLALSGDRSEVFFNPNVANRSLMLNSTLIAVKVGNDWKFYSPAYYFTPLGYVSWIIEGEQALITDPKELIWQRVPLSPAEKTLTKRTGTFKLLEDGSLEGEGTFEFTGHAATYHKLVNRGDTDIEKETTLKNLIKRTISGNAEILNYSIENGTDPEKPFIYRFKIKVPNYGIRTGRRLFFQPNIFEALAKPVFTAADRKSDIYISYPWKESEEVSISLPEGFTLENGDSPSEVIESNGILIYKPKIGISQDGKYLRYSRDLSFGNGGNIRFGREAYPAMKQLFEKINKGDLHQLTLRQASSSTGTAVTKP